MSFDINNLWEGWTNSFDLSKLTPDQIRVMNYRLRKCGNCAFKKERYAQKIIETIVDFVMSKETVQGEFKGFSCGICGCLLQKKTVAFGDMCPAELNRHGIACQWGPATFDSNGHVLTGITALYPLGTKVKVKRTKWEGKVYNSHLVQGKFSYGIYFEGHGVISWFDEEDLIAQ